MTQNRVEGQRALVTGAISGIGRSRNGLRGQRALVSGATSGTGRAVAPEPARGGTDERFDPSRQPR